MNRVREELGGSVLLEYLALVYEEDTLADLSREAHLVRHADHRHALERELLHQVEHLADHLGVERRRRLVEEDNLRIHRERSDYRHTLLLSAGKGRWVNVSLVLETYSREQLHRVVVRLSDYLLLRLLRLLSAEEALPLRFSELLKPDMDRSQHYILDDRLIVEEIELLEHHSHLAAVNVYIDLHIGKRVNEFPMLDDPRYTLEKLLHMVEERQIDAVLIAGDLYDKSAPSAEAVSLVDWFLTALARTNTQVLVCAGNHDSSERVAYGRELLADQGVHVSRVFDGHIDSVILQDEYGPVTFWLIPFLKPATVRPWLASVDPEASDASAITNSLSYTEALQAVVTSLPIDTAQRNVALSHQFVTAGAWTPDTCDSEMSVGGSENVEASVYEPFDYVALGHLHRPQRVGRDTMRYSGSLLKYSASEWSSPKSVPIVELGEKGDITIELAEMPILHDLRRVRGTLEEILDPVRLATTDTHDYICAVLTDEVPPADAFQRLRAAFPNLMSLSVDNTRTRHEAHLEELELEGQASLSPLELFETFWEGQVGAPLDEEDRKIVLDAFEKAQVL